MNPAPDSIEASQEALVAASRRILWICVETNGWMAVALLEEMVFLSLGPGGRIKFGVIEKRNQ